MTGDVVIRAENVGKRYLLGHQSASREGYTALRDLLGRSVKNLGRSALDMIRGRQIVAGDEVEEFWALKDVSFEISRGDVVGIIGRNGAGKSTLLKILSRITEPTTGRIEIRGRVASLLEVGTGFHPELTGRENIYLNGAILGMSRAEIRQKFDEIVAFAEVEQFLDTPVKRYSSGMYVRLAFAVAAHLEPEILVVDEVLAVGDAEFQKKCLGKMQDVAGRGRTVLFVSHNLNAIESLCSRAILLERGRLRADDRDVRQVIHGYLTKGGANHFSGHWENADRKLDHPVLQPLLFDIVDSEGRQVSAPVRNDTQLSVIITADIKKLDSGLNFGIALFTDNSDLILWSLTTDAPNEKWPVLRLGVNKLRCNLPSRFLNEGAYRLEMIASLHFREWIIQPGYNSPAIQFSIQGGLSDSPYWTSARPGLLAPAWNWEGS